MAFESLLMIRPDFRAAVTVGMLLALAACMSIEQLPAPEAVTKPALTGAKPKATKEKWPTLASDGLHDPANPAIKSLQEPAESLATLPANKARIGTGSFTAVGLVVNQDGNKVDWVEALSSGYISPRRARYAAGSAPEPEELVMDMDMFLDLNGSMPIVRFPHLPHTRWLACSNCHPAIFVPQSGANPIKMEKILAGEQCGICHRAVAFPPTDCARCHSVSHTSPEGKRVRADAREKARLKADRKGAVR